MKTINTTLPVYDQLNKQCYERSKCAGGDKDMMAPVPTPRWRFPTMQWKVGTDDPGELISIGLINSFGVETNITDYFNRNDKYIADWANLSYDAFTDPGPPTQAAITDAQKTVAAGEERAAIILYEGASTQRRLYDYVTQPVRIDVTLTLTSGTAPRMELRDFAAQTTTYSNTVTLVAGRNIFFLTPTGNTATELSIVIFNADTELTRFSLVHNNLYGMYASHPRLYTSGADEYFMYNKVSTTIDPTLKHLLDPGLYYLKFTSLGGHVYYSDWFEVECIYPNMVEGWTNVAYETFTTSGTDITSAIETGAAGSGRTNETFTVKIGEVIRVVCFMTWTSGASPTIKLYDGALRSNSATIGRGLNDITLTSTFSGEVYLRIENTAAANFAVSDLLVRRVYSDKFLTLEFSHSCNLGDIIYEDDFVQIMWLKSEAMEPVFPYTEKGQENGYGEFVPTFQRQEKNYLIRTLTIPQFLVDVLHRLKMHDSISLTDLVGDVSTVESIDVEHEWLGDDKYYALATLTVGLGEEIVTTACCTAINECS